MMRWEVFLAGGVMWGAIMAVAERASSSRKKAKGRPVASKSPKTKKNGLQENNRDGRRRTKKVRSMT